MPTVRSAQSAEESDRWAYDSRPDAPGGHFAVVGGAQRGPSAARQRWGSFLLTAGAIVGMLAAVDVASDGAIAPLGRTVPLLLWGLLAAAFSMVGWSLLRTRRPDRWAPEYPGRRFRRVVVYTRENCPLCDEAMALLEEHTEWLPPIETVDVDTQEALQRRFGTEVPVVEIDGRIRFRGRVSRVLLRRVILATPPLPAEERERLESP